MTLINLNPFADVLGGVDIVWSRFSATPKRAKNPAIRISEDRVIFPKAVTAEYKNGKWSAQPNLAPLPVDCYWAIELKNLETQLTLIRNVIVPDTDFIDFDELVLVDPTSGGPSEEALAGWTATLLAIQEIVDNATGVDPEVLAIAIEEYLEEHPIDAADPNAIREAVDQYFETTPNVASNIEWGDDTLPELIFENGLI